MAPIFVTVFATLLLAASAHYCSNGRRLQCMEVQPKGDAPSTFGQGFGAHGSAHCTPAGQKVYCLVNHDYHRCSGDELPCCGDGSDPHHSGHGSMPADTDLVCTSQHEADEVPVTEYGDSATRQESSQQAFKPFEGTLELKVVLAEPKGTLDMCLEILSRDGGAALRVGLASHFGVASKDVKVLDLKPAGRRLLEDQGTHEFQISFTANLMDGGKSTSSSLAADLKDALDAANSGLIVQAAGIKWSQTETSPTASKSQGDCVLFYVAIGVGGVLAFLFIAVASYMCLKSSVTDMKRSSNIDLKDDINSTSSAVESDVKMGKTTEVDDKDDLESNVPSTQDPCDAEENRSIGSDVSPPS
eukprot:TRINITY_DN8664_c0_g2_i1.p1 TRINITY_DN8664_c0_g2~~TRINITY_DN8664_c0_g2_i1.p1  ORF type:complete len:389 (-),score=77.93 TRINITY_DN8664_c0_g2_i1:102-1175(-)